GEVLFRQGDAVPGLIAVLMGVVATKDRARGSDREISLHSRGGVVGLVGTVTGERAYVTAEVREAGEVLIVAPEALRRLFAKDRALGDVVLQLLFRRREWGPEEGGGAGSRGAAFFARPARCRR